MPAVSSSRMQISANSPWPASSASASRTDKPWMVLRLNMVFQTRRQGEREIRGNLHNISLSLYLLVCSTTQRGLGHAPEYWPQPWQIHGRAAAPRELESGDALGSVPPAP